MPVVNWRNHIESLPAVLRGKPCIKGTRVPVALILGFLAARRTVAQVVDKFPVITEADIAASLDYARELAEFEAIPA